MTLANPLVKCLRFHENCSVQDHILGIPVSTNSLVHHHSVSCDLSFVAVHVLHGIIHLRGSLEFRRLCHGDLKRNRHFVYSSFYMYLYLSSKEFTYFNCCFILQLHVLLIQIFFKKHFSFYDLIYPVWLDQYLRYHFYQITIIKWFLCKPFASKSYMYMYMGDHLH